MKLVKLIIKKLKNCMIYDPYEVTFDNYKKYKLLRHLDGCHWNDEHKIWIVSKYTDVVSCLRDYSKYTANYGTTLETKRSELYDNLPFYELDPPAHTEFRKIINRIISSQVSEELKLKIKNNFSNELKSILNKDIDIINSLFMLFPIYVIFDIFGIDKDHLEFIKEQAKKLFDLSSKEEQKEAVMNLAGFFYKNPPGLVIEIAEKEFSNVNLTKKVIGTLCTSIAIAGYETISAELANLVYNCKKHPEEYYRILNNNELIPLFVEESLRHRYLSQFVIRTATVDHVLNNKFIRAGDTVLFLTASAGFDEEFIKDSPDEFLINREINKHNFAFGYGPHTCPGQRLARLEMTSILESIVEISPNFEIISGVLRNKADLSGMMWDSLHMRFLGNDKE